MELSRIRQLESILKTIIENILYPFKWRLAAMNEAPLGYNKFRIPHKEIKNNSDFIQLKEATREIVSFDVILLGEYRENEVYQKGNDYLRYCRSVYLDFFSRLFNLTDNDLYVDVKNSSDNEKALFVKHLRELYSNINSCFVDANSENSFNANYEFTYDDIVGYISYSFLNAFQEINRFYKTIKVKTETLGTEKIISPIKRLDEYKDDLGKYLDSKSERYYKEYYENNNGFRDLFNSKKSVVNLIVAMKQNGCFFNLTTQSKYRSETLVVFFKLISNFKYTDKQFENAKNGIDSGKEINKIKREYGLLAPRRV